MIQYLKTKNTMNQSIPSGNPGNPTWFAGKSTISFHDFPIALPILWSSRLMFDTEWYPRLISQYVTNHQHLSMDLSENRPPHSICWWIIVFLINNHKKWGYTIFSQPYICTYIYIHWLVVLTILKNISSSMGLGWHPIYEMEKHVWNHQPVYIGSNKNHHLRHRAPLQPRRVKWGSTQVVESDGLIRQLLVLVNFKAVFGDFRGIFDVT